MQQEEDFQIKLRTIALSFAFGNAQFVDFERQV